MTMNRALRKWLNVGRISGKTAPSDNQREGESMVDLDELGAML